MKKKNVIWTDTINDVSYRIVRHGIDDCIVEYLYDNIWVPVDSDERCAELYMIALLQLRDRLGIKGDMNSAILDYGN